MAPDIIGIMFVILIYGVIFYAIYWFISFIINNFKNLRDEDNSLKEDNKSIFDGIYKSKRYFFSISELKTYYLLRDYLFSTYNGKYNIFPKVGLIDFIEVNKNIREYQTYYNKMAQKHVDFLIVDQEKHCTPVLAIELNGSSHKSEKVRERDRFVGEVYNAIGLKLITFQNNDLYNKEYIKNEIKKVLIGNSNSLNFIK